MFSPVWIMILLGWRGHVGSDGVDPEIVIIFELVQTSRFSTRNQGFFVNLGMVLWSFITKMKHHATTRHSTWIILPLSRKRRCGWCGLGGGFGLNGFFCQNELAGSQENRKGVCLIFHFFPCKLFSRKGGRKILILILVKRMYLYLEQIFKSRIF